jgi:hypothetical protein
MAGIEALAKAKPWVSMVIRALKARISFGARFFN